MKYLAVVNDDRNKKNELKFNKWKLLKNKNDINALGNISKGANILDKQAMKLPREAFRKINSSTINQTNAKPQFDDYENKQVIKEIRALVYKAHHHCMEHSDMEFHASCIKILTYSILRKIDEMGEI